MLTDRWDTKNIPDQTDKIAVVTGSSSGLGYEMALALANKNASVIVAVRNIQKGNKAADKIKEANKDAKVTVMQLDLADLSSVKKFASEFKTKYQKLNLLINNAGVMAPPFARTKDGFELQFGTTHLGHFALTALLSDVIFNTPDSRIVNLSSNAHKMKGFDIDDVNWEKRKYKRWNAYAASKISNLYFTYELKKRIEAAGKNTIVAAAHPGWSNTELQRHSSIFEFGNILAQPASMGALPALYAGISPDVKSGDYYGPSGWSEWRGFPKKVESNSPSHNKENAYNLWLLSEKLTHIKFDI